MTRAENVVDDQGVGEPAHSEPRRRERIAPVNEQCDQAHADDRVAQRYLDARVPPPQERQHNPSDEHVCESVVVAGDSGKHMMMGRERVDVGLGPDVQRALGVVDVEPVRPRLVDVALRQRLHCVVQPVERDRDQRLAPPRQPSRERVAPSPLRSGNLFLRRVQLLRVRRGRHEARRTDVRCGWPRRLAAPASA